MNINCAVNTKAWNRRGTAHESTAPAGVENAEEGGPPYEMKVLCKQTFLTITVYIPLVPPCGVRAGEEKRRRRKRRGEKGGVGVKRV